MRDPFDVLGLPSTATWPEIEAAHDRLVRVLHPDLHMDQPEHIRKQMSDRMAEVTGAFMLLKDQQAYARWRSRQRPATEPGPRPPQEPFDYRQAAESEFDVRSRQWDYAHRIRPEDLVQPRSPRPPSRPPATVSRSKTGRRPPNPSRMTVVTGTISALIVGAIVGFGLAADPGDSDMATILEHRVATFADGGTPASDLALGVCFDSTVAGIDADGHGRVEAVARRSCAEPHAAEVYGVVDLSRLAGVAYPGRDAITAHVNSVCDRLFDGYVDLTRWPRSILRTGIIYPSAESWPHGDRTAFCEVGAPDGGRLEASVRTDGTGS